MSFENKLNSREAWLRRLQAYWERHIAPHFITRAGEIYEVDFGMNVGTEFSGRHLAICLNDTVPSQEKMLVIPLTTKFDAYNIADEDIIETLSVNGKTIKAGVVLTEAKWISKIRIFRNSKILDESEYTTNPVKGYVEISKKQIDRWRKI